MTREDRESPRHRQALAAFTRASRDMDEQLRDKRAAERRHKADPGNRALRSAFQAAHERYTAAARRMVAARQHLRTVEAQEAGERVA